MRSVVKRGVGLWALLLLVGTALVAGPAQAATPKSPKRPPAAKAQRQAKPVKKSAKPVARPSAKGAKKAAALAAIAPAPSAAPAAPPLDLEALIKAALADNKEIQAQRELVAAEQAKVPQAKALPDPMVGVMGGGFPTEDRGLVLKAQQAFPGPGKRRLMGEAAGLAAQRAAADYAEKQRTVVAQVKQAYYDLYFVDKSTEIAEHNKALLGDFVKLAQTKYSVGKGLQQDVLRAQVAQSRVLDDLLMLRQQRQAGQARLNALLNRSPESPLGPAKELTRHPITTPEATLQKLAVERRPMLQSMQLMAAEAEKMQELARKDRQPNYQAEVDVGTGGGMGGMGPTGVVVGLMVELPLYHRQKQDKAVEQRAAETKAAQSTYEAQKTMVFSMIRDQLSMLEMNGRQIDLYQNGIIPQAELSLESARAGYQVDKVDFLSLLDSQSSLYNDLRTYYRAVADYEKAAADLEQTVGAPLEAGEETK